MGTAGIKILTSKDAKKFYTNCTAAVLRMKDCVMETTARVQENAEDILAEAKQMNEERAEADAVVEETVSEAQGADEAEDENSAENAEETEGDVCVSR